MREMKRFLTVCLCVMLVTTLMIPETTFASRTAALSSRKNAESVGRAGWYRQKNGKKKYYRDGQYVTGQQKIGKYVYMFSKYGNMIKRDITIHKDQSIISHQMDMYQAGKRAGKYYTATGKRMNSTKTVEFRAYQNARKVVAKNTRKSMSKSQKLETCFRWVMKRYYRTWRRFRQGGKAWYAVNANDYFERGCGDCIADASAFAYLAKALGYKNVYVCTDGHRNDENSHGWAEINGRVYDPLFAEAKSYSRNYGVRYGVYPLSPVMRVKIA